MRIAAGGSRQPAHLPAAAADDQPADAVSHLPGLMSTQTAPPPSLTVTQQEVDALASKLESLCAGINFPSCLLLSFVSLRTSISSLHACKKLGGLTFCARSCSGRAMSHYRQCSLLMAVLPHLRQQHVRKPCAASYSCQHSQKLCL